MRRLHLRKEELYANDLNLFEVINHFQETENNLKFEAGVLFSILS